MKVRILVGAVALALSASGVAIAHMALDMLPAGPIRDRHELMEGVGKNAKVIGDAMKTGNFEPVGPAAAEIHTAAGKVLALFPKGSTHENSRAKAEIWQDWDKFESDVQALGAASADLAAAAKAGHGVPDAAQKMFATCKACHDQFRVPEKKQ